MNQITLLNDSKYFDEKNTKNAELRRMLDSRNAKERLEAMKRLMAMMTLGRDVSSFFPDVVKNVISPNTEIKKLVYMYLISYSESNQELALLCINTLQKDLASSSQRNRADALRAMSSIRVPVVIPLVVLALKNAIKDSSAYVRKASAAAIPKVYHASPDQQEELIPMISHLLASTEPEILSSAVFAFHEVVILLSN
jgi:AP-3 complex subunit beta